jgi:histidinol dehydrogenase
MGGSGGNVLISAADITTKNPWKVVSVADFNQDGHPDLLWQDPVSGFAQIWYLGGAQGITLLGAADLDTTNPWQIVGCADFNGDGFPDVLWQDPVSGTVQIWYMGGTQPGAQGTVVESAVNLTANPWHVVAIADFNQDGHPDVVFQDAATGASTVYYYTGAQGTTPNGTATLSGPNPWYIAGPH